mmetsp:Transcript_96182/g.250556  ORF Transcript_96182/g.250556 Transcript_96182/m.250556 type:complete len:427 (+) Transcript_96182:293-1573(+)
MLETSALPRSAASWAGVLCLLSSASSATTRSQERFSMALQTASWPLYAARCSAEKPHHPSTLLLNRWVRSGASSSSCLAIASWPSSAARCNGVKPPCLSVAVTSAPGSGAFSSRARATSSCPFVAARCSAVCPEKPSCVLRNSSFSSALVWSSSAFTASTQPRSEARCSAVWRPHLTVTRLSGVYSSRARTAWAAAGCPDAAAAWSAVWPLRRSRMASSSPASGACSSSEEAVPPWPPSAARCRAVCPSSSVAVSSACLSAARSSSSRVTAWWPSAAARCSAVRWWYLFLALSRTSPPISPPIRGSSSAQATSRCPPRAARCSAVRPQVSDAVHSAAGQGASSSRARHTLAWPPRAARWRAVDFSCVLSTDIISVPFCDVCATSARTVASWPREAAQCRAIWPVPSTASWTASGSVANSSRTSATW